MRTRSVATFAALACGAAVVFASGTAHADEPTRESWSPYAGRFEVAYESKTEQQRRADEQYEYEEGEELDEGEHVDVEHGGGGGRRGGGVSQKTVGLALGISGLIVGLIGGAVTLAGSVAQDEPTLITGAVIGLVGSACGIAGLIVGITAPGGSAANTPTVWIGATPTSFAVGGTF
jgi:hypothetical protein